MKKKILALGLCVAMLAIAVIGGTLAYFTDTDYATNVMVTGNVQIVQNEHERDENGELIPFEDDKPLFPATGDADGNGWIDTYTGSINDKTIKVEGEDVKEGVISTTDDDHMFAQANNAVDKIITVTNDSKYNDEAKNDYQQAYVRTLIAFEIPTKEYAKSVYGEDPLPSYLTYLNSDYVDIINTPHFLMTVGMKEATEGKSFVCPKDNDGNYIIIEKNDVYYLVTVYYYNNNGASVLNAGETSHPSLTQVYLQSTATNDDAQLVVGKDSQYKIIALSQAVQTAGWGELSYVNAKTAFNAAFGELTTENAQNWFNEFTDDSAKFTDNAPQA